MAREEIRYDQALKMVDERRDILGNPITDRELRVILDDYRDRFVLIREEHRALIRRLRAKAK